MSGIYLGIANEQAATAHGEGGPPHLSRDALTKILTARHMIDKRSLLEYSLCKGKAEHFEHLACWIRWKVRNWSWRGGVCGAGIVRWNVVEGTLWRVSDPKTSCGCFLPAFCSLSLFVPVSRPLQPFRSPLFAFLSLLLYLSPVPRIAVHPLTLLSMAPPCLRYRNGWPERAGLSTDAKAPPPHSPLLSTPCLSLFR